MAIISHCAHIVSLGSWWFLVNSVWYCSLCPPQPSIHWLIIQSSRISSDSTLQPTFLEFKSHQLSTRCRVNFSLCFYMNTIRPLRPRCCRRLTLEWQRKPTYSSNIAGSSTTEKTRARSRMLANTTHRFQTMSTAPQATQPHLPLRLPHALPPLWATGGGSIFTPSPTQNSSSFSSSPEPPSSRSTSIPHILREKEKAGWNVLIQTVDVLIQLMQKEYNNCTMLRCFNLCICAKFMKKKTKKNIVIYWPFLSL